MRGRRIYSSARHHQPCCPFHSASGSAGARQISIRDRTNLGKISKKEVSARPVSAGRAGHAGEAGGFTHDDSFFGACAFAMSLNYSRKLKLTNTSVWPHHRGGWRMVVNAIYDSLRDDDGTLFVPVIEEVIANGEIIAEPWVGFVHQVPKTELKWHPDLERLIAHPGWQSSLPYCRGIYTLSGYVRDYLIAQGVPVPIDRILYPADRPTLFFRQKDTFWLNGL
jgi:hypothetical protein